MFCVVNIMTVQCSKFDLSGLQQTSCSFGVSLKPSHCSSTRDVVFFTAVVRSRPESCGPQLIAGHHSELL